MFVPTGELFLIFMLLGPYGVVPVALQLGALGGVARAHGAVVVATATSKSVLISVLISALKSNSDRVRSLTVSDPDSLTS